MKYLFSWAYVLATGLALAGLAVVLLVGHVIMPGPLWQMPWVMALVPGVAMAVGFPFWLARMLRRTTSKQRDRAESISQLTDERAADSWRILLEGHVPGPDGVPMSPDAAMLQLDFGPPATAAELLSLGHADPSVIELFRRHRSMRWRIDPDGLARAANVSTDSPAILQVVDRLNTNMMSLDIASVRPWPNQPQIVIIGDGPSSVLMRSVIATDRTTGRAGIYSSPRPTSVDRPRLFDSWTLPEQASIFHLLVLLYSHHMADLIDLKSIIGKAGK